MSPGGVMAPPQHECTLACEHPLAPRFLRAWWRLRRLARALELQVDVIADAVRKAVRP